MPASGDGSDERREAGKNKHRQVLICLHFPPSISETCEHGTTHQHGAPTMTQLKMIQIAADMIKAGKSDAEIRRALFNLRGARVSQIQQVMALIAA
jgi:hypothetical protein